MPKVSEQHRLDRQDEIIDAALRAFRRKGFQATSMAEIISESGLSAGAIYGYFAGKSEIVLAVATKIVGARVVDIDNLARLDPMPEPARVIHMLLDGLIASVGQPAVLVQVWGEAATDPALRTLCVEIFASLRNALTAYLAQWQQVEHGMSATEARHVAMSQAPLFLSAVQGFVVQDSLLSDFDREHYLTTSLSYLPR
jgi:AcrR family transcriptional regulator